MKYYYNSASFKGSIKLEELKEHVILKARVLAIEVSKALFKNVNYYWTRRDTLGFVFTDFEFETGNLFGSTRERLIGKGEKDLFANIRDGFTCLVLSKTQDKNFRIFNIGSELGIIVNINYFKEFLNIIRDRKNTVKLFLYKFETEQQEELIRGWLRNYGKFDEIRKEALIEDIDAMIDVINKHKIEKAEDLDKLITIARAAGGQIQSNYIFFESKLNEFKTLIDSDVDEVKVRNFLFDYIWILDFQYMSYRKKKEEEVSTGDTDISLLNDELGIERAVVVELKRPSKQVVSDTYRGKDKPVIVSEVGKAISQAIHYLESKKSPYRSLKGIVIIGRKGNLKDEFIKTFNFYLHGIEVLTYDDIYERAKDVISIFKSNQEKASTDIIPVPPPS